MASVSTFITIGLALGGSALQYSGQKKAAKAAKRQAADAAAARQRGEALQTKRENITAARQRRVAAAQARRLRATAVNIGAQRGFGGAIGAQGSTLAGAQGSIQSQLNFNNAFINQVTGLNQGIRSAFGEARDISGSPITAGSGLTAFGGFLKTGAAFGMKYKDDIQGLFSSSNNNVTDVAGNDTGTRGFY